MDRSGLVPGRDLGGDIPNGCRFFFDVCGNFLRRNIGDGCTAIGETIQRGMLDISCICFPIKAT